MKITVNKCPDTGQLFEDDNEYKNHRAKVARRMAKEKKAQSIRDEFKEWLISEKIKLTHPSQVPAWFLANQRIIMDAHNAGIRPARYHGFDSEKFHGSDLFVDVRFEKPLSYDDKVSNSHVCPDSGITNFMCEDSMPIGYPGWKGHINGTLQRLPAHDWQYPYSSALNLVGIKTGSGGGGNKRWGYDVKLFLADWPGFLGEYDRIVEEKRVAVIEAAKQKYEWEQQEILRRLRGLRR